MAKNKGFRSSPNKNKATSDKYDLIADFVKKSPKAVSIEEACRSLPELNPGTVQAYLHQLNRMKVLRCNYVARKDGERQRSTVFFVFDHQIMGLPVQEEYVSHLKGRNKLLAERAEHMVKMRALKERRAKQLKEMEESLDNRPIVEQEKVLPKTVRGLWPVDKSTTPEAPTIKIWMDEKNSMFVSVKQAKVIYQSLKQVFE